jgi:Lrp/AsnC family leucine-responsive transcriptional regulator
MDDLDKKILNILAEHGRVTWSELANSLGLSSPAAAERVKKLEEKGIIKGYTTVMDADTLGIEITAFIFVTISDYKKKEEFIALIDELPEIQECHHIAGEEDFLLKVRCRSIKYLDSLICEKLKGQEMVARTKTNVVLSTDKDSRRLPLD